jgi:hypothetical protein
MRALLAGLAFVALGATSAWAQDPKVVVTGGLDVTNQYNFRGIRQNTEGVSIWPFVDVGIPLASGDGALKSVTLNLGTWNAFHSQINEDDFSNLDGEATGNKWYESDLYATLGLGFGPTVLSFNYTSYTSPANLFSHVKEFGVKVAFDDSAALGRGALKPYALVAFELDDEGQADAGDSKGTYVELGIAPGISGGRASIAFPVKVGLSASDYYEFGFGEDSKFGYFSVAGIVTVPLNANWNIHGGAELQTFGENVKFYNSFGAFGGRGVRGRRFRLGGAGVGAAVGSESGRHHDHGRLRLSQRLSLSGHSPGRG